MSKKKKSPKDPFTDLSWDDLNLWAGSRIVSRGRNYQHQGLVSGLARTSEGGLIAWVDGSTRYATKVIMEDGLPLSICTCPYEYECKHGVATVLEYLEQVKNKNRVPIIRDDDKRLALLAEDDWDEDIDDEEGLNDQWEQELSAFLQGKTKKQLVELILALSAQHPEVAEDIMDRKQTDSGDSTALVTRLRRDIQNIGVEPDWLYDDEPPNYLLAGDKLEMLLKTDHADDVLTLGKDIMAASVRQIEQGYDDVTMDLERCVPVLLKALNQSSLAPADRLAWVVDALMEDDYDLFDDLGKYLDGRHTKTVWSALADQLLARLKAMTSTKKEDEFHRSYARDRLSNWAIHALEQSGRDKEVIPLCEKEAPKTQSYVRLVEFLIEAKRYPEAQQWIKKGIQATQERYPGITSGLRSALRTIYAKQRDWKAVAALQVQEFVWQPSTQTFKDCRKAATKVKLWNKIRPTLLTYLEKGKFPWQQKDWPLSTNDLIAPKPNRYTRFPMLNGLIDIAILEKKPDQVLHWYERRPKKDFWGHGLQADEVATAIQAYAPDRAVAMWQHMAEVLIAQTNPRAYEEAAQFLRKAGGVMAKQKKKTAWSQYLKTLRQTHARKRRFLEILDGLDGTPIIKKRR